MSKFEVKIKRIKSVKHHENADRLDVVQIDDYQCITSRDTFVENSLIVYIPEAAIVPDWLISELGLEGKLAGKDKNRVKAVKLRGILSQGLIYQVHSTRLRDGYGYSISRPLTDHQLPMACRVHEGSDVTDFLGITKWEPPIPTCMNGEVYNAFGYTLTYDIENIKRHPDVFEDGEEVSITEKIHGTWSCFGSHPMVDVPVITSKGLSEKGLAFKFNDANKGNLYIRTFHSGTENEKTIIERAAEELDILLMDTPLYLLGEIFGMGVQDLLYGIDKPQFRLFDIYLGEPGQGKYVDAAKLPRIANALGVGTVPELYVGPYSKDIVQQYTDGDETVSGQAAHMREGVVIKPTTERRDTVLGRVFLKSVSEAYLLRKGKKTTEFQ